MGLAAAIVIPLALAVFERSGRISPVGPAIYWILAISAVLVYSLWFPGNLAAFFPYQIKIDCALGLVLFGPFKKIVIPISDLGDLEKSLFWQGDVVLLRRPHAALTQFVIPWYFGPERRALLSAIRLAVEQSPDN